MGVKTIYNTFALIHKILPITVPFRKHRFQKLENFYYACHIVYVIFNILGLSNRAPKMSFNILIYYFSFNMVYMLCSFSYFFFGVFKRNPLCYLIQKIHVINNHYLLHQKITPFIKKSKYFVNSIIFFAIMYESLDFIFVVLARLHFYVDLIFLYWALATNLGYGYYVWLLILTLAFMVLLSFASKQFDILNGAYVQKSYRCLHQFRNLEIRIFKNVDDLIEIFGVIILTNIFNICLHFLGPLFEYGTDRKALTTHSYWYSICGTFLFFPVEVYTWAKDRVSNIFSVLLIFQFPELSLLHALRTLPNLVY